MHHRHHKETYRHRDQPSITRFILCIGKEVIIPSLIAELRGIEIRLPYIWLTRVLYIGHIK